MIRDSVSKLAVALLLAGAATGLTSTAIAQQQSTPVNGVVMDAYAIASDPPGDIRVAPGGGRVLTPVILFKPAAGENIHGPAVIMINRGPNSNPGRAGEPSRWMAERLAQKGYTVLSVQTHMDRGFPLFPFEETSIEIDAAITSLEERGYEDFILIGNEYGAAAAAHYVANSADKSLDKAGVRRVRGVVLIDPITELRKYPGLEIDKNYDAMMALAQKEYATGKNGYTASRTIEVGGGPADGGRDWLGSGFFVAPAEAFLNYWSPAAAARNEKNYKANPDDTLVMAHSGNAMVSIDKLKSLGMAHSELRTYAGDKFEATSFDSATDDVLKWLAKLDLAPRPRVIERLVDTTTADGTVLPGMVYMPEVVDPKKPAMILAHGRSGDIIQSSTHWMGWRFAQKGYVVLSPSFRVSGAGGIQTGSRAGTIEDMSAWMKTLHGMGYNKILATGHSNGGIWISDYKVVSKDKSIVGMIYFAPTANVTTWTERQANKAQMAQLAEAKKAVEKGDGSHKVYGVQSATLVYDSLRKESISHPERLTQITEPGLFVIGGHDGIFKKPNVKDRLVKAYAGKLDQIYYEDAGHGLREAKDRIATDVDLWVKKTFPE